VRRGSAFAAATARAGQRNVAPVFTWPDRLTLPRATQISFAWTGVISIPEVLGDFHLCEVTIARPQPPRGALESKTEVVCC
jgi:hypothetical protein